MAESFDSVWAPEPWEDGHRTVLAPHALDSLVGKVVPHRLRTEEGGEILAELGQVKVTAVQVAPDGLSAIITYEPLEDSDG